MILKEEAKPVQPPSAGRVDIRDFLVSHGGPFYELQRRLKLLRERSLHVGLRAAIFVGLAWGVPFVLSLLTGHAFGPYSQRPFVLDLGAWARFFVAVGLFILMERQVERGLSAKLAQFVRAPVIAPTAMSAAAEAVTEALRRRDSPLAELVCLALAALATIASLANIMGTTTSSWLAVVSPSGSSLTAAGWWCLLVSSPIFWFLLLRGLWRHFVWSMLLRRLARLELRLVATHPDGKGGLAFIGEYPNAYATFILAISCVVGAALANELFSGQLSTAVYGSVMGVWLAIMLALFAFPLSAFTSPLSKLKQKTLALAGSQATRYHRLSERKALGANIVAADTREAESETDIPDSSALFDKTRKMSVFLVSRSTLIPVCAAAILPLAAAGITRMPYKEVLAIAKKLLLL